MPIFRKKSKNRHSIGGSSPEPHLLPEAGSSPDFRVVTPAYTAVLQLCRIRF